MKYSRTPFYAAIKYEKVCMYLKREFVKVLISKYVELFAIKVKTPRQ
jgi:hypothetical protein